MNLYNNIVDIYTKSITNLFTISGNFNDYSIFDDQIQIIKNKLLDDLSLKSHVILYSPSNGMRYYNPDHLKELYVLEPTLKEEHKLVFKGDFSNSHYNIISGLHMIKEMVNTYRRLKNKYKNQVKNLIVFIDSADIIFPIKQIDQMSIDEKMAISLIREMTSSSHFMNGTDVIVLAASSYNSINEEVRELPSNHHIPVNLPSYKERLDYVNFINKEKSFRYNEELREEIALKTAGLDLITLTAILKKGKEYINENLVSDVSNIIANKLGKHIEILHPRYGFEAVIGYDKLKEKAYSLIKRMYTENPWRGLAYVGPTGSGKDFQTEAFLYEAKLPILKLKSIKSKWYGETAIILENIKQVARSFDKVVIFKPEADKLFPDPEDKQGHQTDQEVAGVFLDWMSDSRDSGKIFWVFNTSRPQMFPVDFQRRIEIKLPILDLKNDDKYDFIKKMFKIKKIDIEKIKLSKEILDKYNKFSEKNKHKLIFLNLTEGYSSDNIRMIVNEVAAELEINSKANIIDIISDLNISVVTKEREKQTEYAKSFSTYKSLIE